MFSLVEYFFHLRMNSELGCGGNDVFSYWFFNFLADHVVLISATHPIAVTDVPLYGKRHFVLLCLFSICYSQLYVHVSHVKSLKMIWKKDHRGRTDQVSAGLCYVL